MIRTMAHQAHAYVETLVPGNHFDHEEKTFRGPQPSNRKLIKIEVDEGSYALLEYGGVDIVMLRLLQYMNIWIKGTKNSQVYMCNFTYLGGPGRVYEVAKGRAIISRPEPSDSVS